MLGFVAANVDKLSFGLVKVLTRRLFSILSGFVLLCDGDAMRVFAAFLVQVL